MPTVALVGPDGAGKTTVSRRLADELGVPVKSIYMGVNLDSSGLMLPTTRLLLAFKRARGQRPDMVATSDRDVERPRPRGVAKRGAASLKSATRLTVWLGEEWFRQLVAWYWTRLRGHLVVFDRHFFADYYDYDVAATNGTRPLARSIHGFLLAHAYPKPDLVIYLDAPAEVLFERKGEASVEWLQGRREAYLRLKDHVPRFTRVDASRPLDEVTREVADIILRFETEDHGRADGRNPTP